MLVGVHVVHSVSAVSVRAAKTPYRSMTSPLQNEPASLGFILVTKEQGRIPTTHSKPNKGDKRGTLVEPALHRTDEG